MRPNICNRVSDERGQTFAEYALLTSAILLSVMAAFAALGTGLRDYIAAAVSAL